MSARALGRDEFAKAFAQHGRSLWVLASAWVGREQADDLVQETARVAWQQRDQFDVSTEPRPWLSRIARNLAANWRRKMRVVARDPSELPEAAAPPAVDYGWPFDADRAGLSDELASALAGLPETARACLLLHVVMGMSFVEIATMLDNNENTVSSHVRRSRTALRKQLRAQVDPESAVVLPEKQ